MCACGNNSNIQALTTNQAQALIDAAREAAEAARNEQEAMVASAQQAVLNASSGSSAMR
jgi:hypothetical protein